MSLKHARCEGEKRRKRNQRRTAAGCSGARCRGRGRAGSSGPAAGLTAGRAGGAASGLRGAGSGRRGAESGRRGAASAHRARRRAGAAVSGDGRRAEATASWEKTERDVKEAGEACSVQTHRSRQRGAGLRLRLRLRGI